MSHTLHRSGSVESLQHDFPMHAMGARGFNRDGCADKMYALAEVIVMNYPVANTGIVGFEEKITRENLESDAKPLFEDSTMIHAVFTDPEQLTACLKELKEKDFGLSVTVSGLFDVVHDCCRKAGLEPHTVNMSLGVWGAVEKKMPAEEKISEISSMCGHGMIPFPLVEAAVEKVKSGKLTPEEAANQLVPTCTCHIFNPQRAAELIRDAAK